MTELNFDLPAIDTLKASEDGTECTIRRLDTGKPLVQANKEVLKIRLAGPDSKIHKRETRKQMRARLKRQSAEDFDPGTEENMAESDAEALAHLVACTLGWNAVLADKSPAPSTPEAFASFYRQYPAAREQAEAHYNQRRNFITAS